MERVIAKMRADFDQVASLRCAAGLWSQADASDANRAIREAIEKDDRGLVLVWARWLADLSAWDLKEAHAVPVPPPAPRGCVLCVHRRRPGQSAGYCSGREDLARVYGTNHPLRVLPDDGGVSCARFERTQ